MERLVLEIPERGHRRHAGSLGRITRWHGDAARSQKGFHTLISRAAIHVAPVVVEKSKRSGVAMLCQKLIEGLLPGSSMQAGRVDQDPVHVEDDCLGSLSGHSHQLPTSTRSERRNSTTEPSTVVAMTTRPVLESTSTRPD